MNEEETSFIDINIGLFGCSSVGKSSFINALSGKYYSPIKLGKTTFVPQYYIHSNLVRNTDEKTINNLNNIYNESAQKIINKKELVEDFISLKHYVHNVNSWFGLDEKSSNIRITVCDIPGLDGNNYKMSDWLDETIASFDIMIFVTDIHRGLNDSNSENIIRKLMKHVAENGNYLVCLMNKCDNCIHDPYVDDIILENVEQEEMYVSINKKLDDIATEYNISSSSNLYTNFIPVSLETAYMFRTIVSNGYSNMPISMIDRLGRIELGTVEWNNASTSTCEEMLNLLKDNIIQNIQIRLLKTGYYHVITAIKELISTNQTKFIIRRIDNKIKSIKETNVNQLISNPNDLIELLRTVEHNKNINLCDKTEECCKLVADIIIQFSTNFCSSDMNIYRLNNLISVKEFDRIHKYIQTCCENYWNFVDAISAFSFCPIEAASYIKQDLVSELYKIYDPLLDSKFHLKLHSSVDRMTNFLNNISIYDNKSWTRYACEFMKILDKKLVYRTFNDKNDPNVKFIISILKRIKRDTEEYQTIFASIIKIFISKQLLLVMTSNQSLYDYLVSFRECVKKFYDENPDIRMLNVLLNITNKNINDSVNCLSIFSGTTYIDTKKIDNLLINCSNKYDISADEYILNELIN